MASPIGHALAGYAIARLGPGGAALTLGCIALAVAPDLDFLPGLLAGTPSLYHQGVSHSLAVACVASLLVFAALRPASRDRARVFGVLFAAYASHLVLDMVGSDARPPFGIPLFWPLSDVTLLSSVALLPGIQHSVTGTEGTREWLAHVLTAANARAVALELGIVAAAATLAWIATQYRGRVARSPGASR